MGVDHVGVGVGDMEAAMDVLRSRRVRRVLFDYTGELPGPSRSGSRAARVVMLENRGATPIGAGRVKLVQVLDGDGPPPVPTGGGWGELGDLRDLPARPRRRGRPRRARRRGLRSR